MTATARPEHGAERGTDAAAQDRGPRDGRRPPLRIGTRGSQLALWQARTVAEQLDARGEATEIVIIKTTGDHLSEASLSEAGGKRLFVKEIEEALLRGEIDLAVHSAKDMPVASADGLAIAAVLPREEPWDALVLPAHRSAVGVAAEAIFEAGRELASVAGFDPGAELGPHATRGDIAEPEARAASATALGSLEQVIAQLGAGTRVGTSSVRRLAQLRRALPGATFLPIRGNLDTRLRKLDEGPSDLLVLATAGLKRLGAEARISARLPGDWCLPAPGQGVIAIQIRADDVAVRDRVAVLDDAVTAQALIAERAVVDTLGGGCQTPIAAFAQPIAAAPVPSATPGPVPAPPQLQLDGLVISLDGTRVIRASVAGEADAAAALGARVGRELLAQGAADILAEFSLDT